MTRPVFKSAVSGHGYWLPGYLTVYQRHRR